MEKVPEPVSNEQEREAHDEWIPLTWQEKAFVWVAIFGGQAALGLLIYLLW